MAELLPQLNQLGREPTLSELQFFKAKPHVAGMASKDNRVVLNPFTSLNEIELRSVFVNEVARLIMRQNKLTPNFQLTPEQQKVISGTVYEKDPIAARETIAARIISGDPSAGKPTKEQKAFVDKLRPLMFRE